MINISITYDEYFKMLEYNGPSGKTMKCKCAYAEIPSMIAKCMDDERYGVYGEEGEWDQASPICYVMSSNGWVSLYYGNRIESAISHYKQIKQMLNEIRHISVQKVVAITGCNLPVPTMGEYRLSYGWLASSDFELSTDSQGSFINICFPPHKFI